MAPNFYGVLLFVTIPRTILLFDVENSQGLNMEKCKVHKYHRKDIGVNKEYLVWACENCTHYIAYGTAGSNLRGKTSRCSVCDEPFMVLGRMVERAKPRCENCVGKKDKDDIVEVIKDPKALEIEELTKKILEGMGLK